MGRKGQSEVITTVLIILIVLAAIFIVFTVVRGMLRREVETAQSMESTIGASIAVDKQLSTIGGTTKIVLKRSSGGGNVTGIRFVIKNGSGANLVYTNYTPINVLESRAFSLPASTGVSNITYVEIYPVFSSGAVGPKQDEFGTK